jgi:hypothetical protein
LPKHKYFLQLFQKPIMARFLILPPESNVSFLC